MVSTAWTLFEHGAGRFNIAVVLLDLMRGC